MTQEEKAKCYKEYIAILEADGPEIMARIPKKYLDYYYEHADPDYVPNIDFSKPLEDQKLLDGTYALMVVNYINYIEEDEEERKRMIEQLKRNDIKAKLKQYKKE